MRRHADAWTQERGGLCSEQAVHFRDQPAAPFAITHSMVGISKTEVGDGLDLLLPELATLGYCQPDGTFVTTLDDLRALLVGDDPSW